MFRGFDTLRVVQQQRLQGLHKRPGLPSAGGHGSLRARETALQLDGLEVRPDGPLADLRAALQVGQPGPEPAYGCALTAAEADGLAGQEVAPRLLGTPLQWDKHV
eukprot:scaffold79992_cov40-Prasinocladus_malaysianus.AAC.1